MNPLLATVVTLAGIVALIWWDSRRNDETHPALWLPVLWLFIAGSRFVSEWLALGQPLANTYEQGSEIDAAFFALVICAGILVLVRRRILLTRLLRDNFWLFAFVALGFASIAWSDESVIALKRWLKTLGHPVMALIIITDADPRQALRAVLKRSALLLLPLSVLFIKYWPEFGRNFDAYSGLAMNNGVGQTKNDLGYVCMVMGIFFLWNLLLARTLADAPRRRWEMALSAGALACIGWLLYMADSVTSLGAMALGMGVILLLGQAWVSKRHFGTFMAYLLLLIVPLEVALDLSGTLLQGLGRNTSLTDRTLIWADVLAMQQQPLFGYGFESFWLGSRMEFLWQKWWWKPNQAHNGYIETYLSLGMAGVAALAAMILAAFFKIERTFDTDFHLARLHMALLLAIVAFNFTEAGFKAVHFIWTVFYLVALRYDAAAVKPRREAAPSAMLGASSR